MREQRCGYRRKAAVSAATLFGKSIFAATLTVRAQIVFDQPKDDLILGIFENHKIGKTP
jgi:hypothetical protein